jgi:AcrR family transcriptional regulator
MDSAVAPRRRRRSPEEGLVELADAAAVVLSRKSIARAQMSDVAAEMGVSPGNLYNYVESKDVLLGLVLHRALDGELPDAADLPISVPPLTEMIDWLDRRLDWVSDFPVLEAAMARRRRPSDLAQEVGDVAVELYDVLARVRPVVAVLERSGGDIPRLGAILQRVRGEVFARMEGYVELRGKSLRRLPDARLATRLIVEAISYMALRRPADPKAPEAPEAVVRDSVRALAVHLLLTDKEVKT